MSGSRLDESVIFNAVRIDRAGPWGNPFVIGINGDRQTVCEVYEVWLKEWMINGIEIRYKIGNREYSNKWVIEHLSELRGKDLVCWCAPERCHGDTLLRLVEALEKGSR